jgi:hypothetical protein
MTKILSSTLRRLKKLKRTNAIWEGDRRVLPKGQVEREPNSNLIHMGNYLADAAMVHPHCILWVDGSLGIVRAMEVVKPDLGPEAIVRNLLLAMERPQGSVVPCLPQKILVCDRSLQFYLRGVLQDLDILVEHVEDLPLIDEIFHNILDQGSNTPPPVPQAQAIPLYAQTERLWELAPWDYMWDYQVLAVRLNYWDIDSLYAVVMGKLGLEKGIVLYRDPESLVEFRQQVSQDDEDEDDDDLEEVFLRQDCFFSLFESTEDLSEAEIRYFRAGGCGLVDRDVYPIFGSVNPMEGGRSYLDEEEASILTAALEALNGFFSQHHKALKSKRIKDLSHSLRVAVEHIPQVIASENLSENTFEGNTELEVEVRSVPELSLKLHPTGLVEPVKPRLYQDLLPENSLIKLLDLSSQMVEILRAITPSAFIAPELSHIKGLFGLLVQTSRPKALNLIQEIEDRGGILALGFTSLEDTKGNRSELGLVQMGNGNHQLFGKYDESDVQVKHWKLAGRRQSYCAVMISMGVTGASAGQLVPEYILGYYEVRLLTAKELGLGMLMGH